MNVSRLRKDRGTARSITMMAIVLACVLTLAACDSGFRVRGDLVVDPQQEPCELRLHNASDGAVLRRRSVRGSFQELFTVSVIPRDYYMTITCNNTKDSFKSATFRLGYRRYYDPPLSLGKIVISQHERQDLPR